MNYSVTEQPDRLPQITVTQQEVDRQFAKVFGSEKNRYGASVSDFCDSDWSRAYDQYYQEHIVYVRGNSTVVLRFQYDYEVDLDRIRNEGDLLRWSLHLCGKTWMNTARLAKFIQAVADIKKLRIHGLA